ncbi:MAG: hypothetical protein ACD_13C00015G0034 [uncultured bacterium]|nr:MAG: hypothetical protein ACD_13C00015G0034 [uncultured bacterium]
MYLTQIFLKKGNVRVESIKPTAGTMAFNQEDGTLMRL